MSGGQFLSLLAVSIACILDAQKEQHHLQTSICNRLVTMVWPECCQQCSADTDSVSPVFACIGSLQGLVQSTGHCNVTDHQ